VHKVQTALLIGYILIAFPLVAQVSPQDSPLIRRTLDRVDSTVTSLPIPDSLKTDSLLKRGLTLKSKLDSLPPVDKDDLDTIIVYTARDSIEYNVQDKSMNLYGAAKINYQEFNLAAPKVYIDMNTNLLTAESRYDSLQRPAEFPKFGDASGKYDAEKMTYNFKTKRGKIAELKTELENGYYKGENIKRMEDGVLYVGNGTYTTCNLNHPHFWFQCNNMKVIPGDRVIARPVVMYIEGVPVFALPFAFFPMQKGRQSGIIVPRYGRDNFLGFYLAQGGYYVAINEYTDLRLEGDIGSFGSWRLSERFRYAKRYDLNGTLLMQYQRSTRNEISDPDFLRNDTWLIDWQHNQTFNPTTTLSGGLRFIGGSTLSINTPLQNAPLQQQATSNLAFTKIFAEGQRSFNATYQRNQTLQTTNVGQSLTMAITQQKIFPFRGRRGTGENYYERFALEFPSGLSSALNFQNTDTTFARTVTINTGISPSYQFSRTSNYIFALPFTVSATNIFNASPSATTDRKSAVVTTGTAFSGTVLKYFNIGAGISLQQNFTDQSVTQFFNPFTNNVVTVTNQEWGGYYTYNVSGSLQTRIFGTFFPPEFVQNLIGVKALRHTINPQIGFAYNPDFTSEAFGFYRSFRVNADSMVRYSRFGVALPTRAQTMSISLANIFEAKVRTLDTAKAIDDPERTERKIQLLNLNLSSGYNFVAQDGFNWSPISLSANSTSIPNIQLSGSAAFDYYGFDSTGRRVPIPNRLQGGGILRFTSGSLNFGTSFRGQRRENKDRLVQTDSARVRQQQTQQQQQGLANTLPNTDFRSLGQNTDFDIPWELSLGLNLTATRANPLQDITYNAQAQATYSVSITPNWQLRASATYLVQTKQFVAPTLSVNRDLHCWTMSFNWVPVGVFRSYFFTLQIKAPQLRDIRVEQNQFSQNLFLN
jgi:lipopolysaccharide assembly outer membrane protein LptD (OstA)